MYWIREYKDEDFVQVYHKSERHNGWKIILQMYDIEKFNKTKRSYYER